MNWEELLKNNLTDSSFCGSVDRKVTKKEIIELVSKRTTTRKSHTRAIIESSLDVFLDILTDEGRIEIRNFGVFRVKDTPARIGRNPVTKEVADVPARKIVQFKAGKVMKEIVNSNILSKPDGGDYGKVEAAAR
jgi:nucleoid DNA-binding protein